MDGKIKFKKKAYKIWTPPNQGGVHFVYQIPLLKTKSVIYYIYERIVESNYSICIIQKGEIQND